MRKFFQRAILLFSVLTFFGCGGGGSSGNGEGNATLGLSHNELAEAFAKELNATGQYNVSVVKQSSYVANYIVIYDSNTNQYNAISIKGYSPGSDIVSFLAKTNTYQNLIVSPGRFETYLGVCGQDDCYRTDWIDATYHDQGTGIFFEKSNEVSKDVSKYSALAEELVSTNRAQDVSERFGLEIGRAKEVVRLAMAWQRAGGKNLTNADQDAFSREMLGFSITEAKSALKAKASGDNSAVEELMQKAADINNITIEHMNELVEKYLGQ